MEASQRETLEAFYRALYVSPDLDAMSRCLFGRYRENFRHAMTFAGAEERYYQRYRAQAEAALLGKFEVSVRIDASTPVPAERTVELRRAYPEIAAAAKVSYDIVFHGSRGERIFTNIMYMVEVGGLWYMGTHLKLPIGTNISAVSAN